MKTNPGELNAALRGFERELRGDGWANPLTGAGILGRDKASAITFAAGGQLSDATLAALYTHDSLAARGVDVYPREAMRLGYMLGGLDTAESAVTDYLDPFELVATITSAWVWARLFGGAAIWVGVNDADASVPLGTYSRVDFLRVIDRRWLTPDSHDATGRTDRYRVTPPGQRTPIGVIHASRLVLWPGARTEDEAKTLHLLGWDYSVLQRAFDALKSDGALWTNVLNLVEEATISIFKLSGLFSLVASGEKNASLERYGVINRLKGMYRAVVLDKEKEEFEQKAAQAFTGLADLSDRAIKRVASAFELPVTVLLGEAPAGLNATGDVDMRWLLDRIVAERTQIAEPRIRRLLSMLLAAGESPAPRGYRPQLIWPSLWTPSAAEQADIYSKTMAADAIGIDKQLWTPDEIFLARVGRDGWSPDLQFSEDARRLRQESLDAAYEPAAATPEPVAPDAQAESLMSIVTKVASGTLPRDSAAAIIELTYGLSPEDAQRVLGSAGTTFTITAPAEEPNDEAPDDSGSDLPGAGEDTAEAGAGSREAPSREQSGG